LAGSGSKTNNGADVEFSRIRQPALLLPKTEGENQGQLNNFTRHDAQVPVVQEIDENISRV
jgi:hypothetical protein